MGGVAAKPIAVHDLPMQTNKIILVTGGNTGIGYASIEHLAAKGPETIVVAGRSETKINEAVSALAKKYPSVRFLGEVADISSFESIESFSQRLNASLPRIDTLIDNAGVFLPHHSKTPQGFEVTIGTNAIGTAYLTAKLLPLLAKSPSPRIVVVSSGSIGFLNESKFLTFMEDLTGENLTVSNMDVYAFSKAANTLYAMELQKRLKTSMPTAVVVSVDPGAVLTDIQNKTDKNGLLARFLGFLYPYIAKSPAQGALPVVYCATSDDLQDPKLHGTMFGEGPSVQQFKIPAYITPANATKVYSAIEEAIVGKGGAM